MFISHSLLNNNVLPQALQMLKGLNQLIVLHLVQSFQHDIINISLSFELVRTLLSCLNLCLFIAGWELICDSSTYPINTTSINKVKPFLIPVK